MKQRQNTSKHEKTLNNKKNMKKQKKNINVKK